MKIVKISAIWCPGCIVMNKIWKKIKEKYPNVEIINYDYDTDEELVQSYSPGKILPVTIFLKDNKELERLNGEKTEQEIIDIIERYSR